MAATLSAIALAGTLGALVSAGAPSANAATPSCGSGCIDIFNDQFSAGIDSGHPGFLLDTFRQSMATGNPLILFQSSNHDPAEDWNIENQGTVADFYAAGLISSSFALHYGCVAHGPGHNFPNCVFATHPHGNADLKAYEIEYNPFGAPTGQCVGVAATPFAAEPVTLQPCGVSGKTIWVVDSFDGSGSPTSFGDDGVFGHRTNDSASPLLNGAGMNFSRPFALTYPGTGFPTDMPRPRLFVTNLSAFFNGIFPSVTAVHEDVNSNQVWDALTGPVTG